MRRLVWIVGFIALAAGLTAVAYLFVMPSTDSALDSALQYISRADVSIIQLDNVLNQKVTSKTYESVKLARSGIVSAQESLQKASSIVKSAKLRASPAQRRRIALIDQAIVARREMLELAPPLLAVTESSAQALLAAGQAWESIDIATVKSAQALKEFDKQTKAGVSASHALNTETYSIFVDAKAKFVEASTAFEQADFSSYQQYLDVRIKMVKKALSSDEHWLKGEYLETNADIVSYNSLAKKAADIAEKSLTVPSNVIIEAYSTIAGTMSEDYFAARSKVLQIDTLVR